MGEEWLEKAIKDSLLPFLRDLLEKLTSPLERVMERGTGTLSHHFLSCYTELYGKPDFSQMGRMVHANPIVRFLKPIVVADWPEEQKVPEGWPQFVVELQEMVLILVSSFLGSCSRPMPGLQG